ncbi:MAG TPA: 50S ribosomal protein L6 [Firmicutes bacterium]|nr:50S ribosomal protein L6 [Bacillota bacterium]
MSRIGKMPVEIPSGVEVKVDGQTVTVRGPKGTLTQEFHPDMIIALEGNTVVVRRPSDEKQHRALHGLTRALIANMIEGVTKGYQKDLEISGVGYRAALQGKKLVLTMGFSHPVEFEPEPGIEFEVPAPTRITVRGIDKQLVGETAARIRAVRPPEPYLGKGIRYAGERIRRKAGKAGKV